MIAAVLLAAVSLYGDVDVGVGIGWFGSHYDGGRSWGIPVSLGIGLQGNHWRAGLEGRYQRRLYIDKELSREPASHLVDGRLCASFGGDSHQLEHRIVLGLGAAYDSKLDGAGFVVDGSYVLTYVPLGLFVQSGIWGGGVFGYRQYVVVAQLYAQVGWHFLP